MDACYLPADAELCGYNLCVPSGNQLNPGYQTFQPGGGGDQFLDFTRTKSAVDVAGTNMENIMLSLKLAANAFETETKATHISHADNESSSQHIGKPGNISEKKESQFYHRNPKSAYKGLSEQSKSNLN